ncbi:response regulator transcription factor [Bradyrhizobium sp. CB3481]|uniref:response regulator transcription factor n=1 Tax=Bradyrhizobium sp. CB3481 TaxID=3039158 RepID=UPI0024B08900|nr:response regulator transcription factor [Bradyrhizobium sp. CB3481]WFU18457.1 response regulator transcription factor [Bradyrhizobium sp. CB3481]
MTRATTDTLLVGQNALLREGLARILSSAGFRIFASGCSVDELIPNSFPQQPPILLVIDVGDDVDVAFAQLKSFKQRCPAGRVALLAHQRQLSTMISAFRLGANAYLAKSVASDTFIKTLELVMLGVTFLPPEILSFICYQQEQNRGQAASHCGDAAHPMTASEDKHGDAAEMVGIKEGTNELVPHDMASLTPLSTRQQSILRCLIQGDSNKSIARKLAISEATAKVHVKSILRKIRVHNRTQAAIWAISSAPLISAKNGISHDQVAEAAAPAEKHTSLGRLAN